MQKIEIKSIAFNKKNITSLAESIVSIYPEFKIDNFLSFILHSLDTLELKERSNLIENALIKFLPKPFENGIEKLLKSLPKEITDNKMSGYDGFILMPQTGYVAKCGMDNFELSMKALYEMTKRFTSEFHIRYFIVKHYEKTMVVLEKWCEDENVHVRRLVSEGTRSRLPWAFALNNFKKNPKPVIKLLNKLKNDSELYVRRSVANNLNDISKDNPKIVIQTLKEWQNGTKEMAWLTKHALRTLIKSANPEALALLGYTKSKNLIVNVKLNSLDVIFGEYLKFEIDIHSQEEITIPIMIDFIIYYKKANNTLSPKVFKLSTKKIKPDTRLKISKKHKFADFSTRKHYAGEHKISVVVNGTEYEKYPFNLKFIN